MAVFQKKMIIFQEQFSIVSAFSTEKIGKTVGISIAIRCTSWERCGASEACDCRQKQSLRAVPRNQAGGMPSDIKLRWGQRPQFALNIVFKMMDFVLKMMNSVLKLVDFAWKPQCVLRLIGQNRPIFRPILDRFLTD